MILHGISIFLLCLYLISEVWSTLEGFNPSLTVICNKSGENKSRMNEREGGREKEREGQSPSDHI